MRKINHVKNILDLFIKKLKDDSICIDATVGNGNDILYLLNDICTKGFVYGFDIQSEAIENTKALLKLNNIFDRHLLINESHENMGNYIKEDTIDCILFNLGYLPKGDKCITTEYSSTWKAIKEGLLLLRKNGFIALMLYPGHSLGMIEAKSLELLVKTLDQKKFSVFHINFINQRNYPPELIIIQKL